MGSFAGSSTRFAALLVFSMLMASLPGAISAAPTPTPLRGDEPSGPGGIGNTRADILDRWDIRSSTRPAFEYVLDHKQDVTYDTIDFQLSFAFQLQGDDKPRDDDRALLIGVSLISSVSVSQGERMAADLLPDDAKKNGPQRRNRFQEPVQLYQSEAIEELFPDLEIEGERPGNPGRIWVTLYPGDDTVSVVEVALFDTSVY